MSQAGWIERPEFVAAIGAALAAGAGYAAGKIGFSEQSWLYYPIFLAERPNPRQRNPGSPRLPRKLRPPRCRRRAKP